MHPDLQEGESLQVAPTRLKRQTGPVSPKQSAIVGILRIGGSFCGQLSYMSTRDCSGTSRVELLAQARLDNGNDSIHDVASTLMRPSVSMACSKILEPTWSTFKARMLTSTHILVTNCRCHASTQTRRQQPPSQKCV
jgi:predicted metal-binding protein